MRLGDVEVLKRAQIRVGSIFRMGNCTRRTA